MRRPWLLAVLLSACATPPAARTTAPAHVVPDAPRASDWHFVHYPEAPAFAKVVQRLADGGERLVLGGQRVERRGGSIAFARQALLEPILRSCASGPGFVHFAASGAVYWSVAFLADFKMLGQTRRMPSLQECGPAAVTSTSPRELWTQAGVTRLSTLPEGASVHFSSALEGVANAFPDRTFVSHDGGKSFALLPAGPYRDALPVDHVVAELGDASVGLAELRVAWMRRAMASEVGSQLGAVSLRSGARYRVLSGQGEDELDTVVLRAPSGAISTIEVPSDCRPTPWGDRLLADCGAKIAVLYPPGVPALPAPPADAQALAADREGRFLFAKSPHALLRFDGKAWQSYANVPGVPVSARSDWLLLSQPWRLLRASDPGGAALELESDLGEDEALLGVTLLEHSVLVLKRRGRVPRYGEPHPPVELSELELGSGRVLRREPFTPFDPAMGGSYEASFADARHAVSRFDPWRSVLTSDGGRTFVDAHAAAQLGLQVKGPFVCGDEMCTLGPTHGWTRLPLANDANVLPTPTTLPDPPSAPDRPSVESRLVFAGPTYSCEPQGKLPSPEQLQGVAGAPRGSEPLFLALPGVGGMLDLGKVVPRVRLAWSGWDTAGAYRVETPETDEIRAWSQRVPPQSFVFHGDSVRPVLITRRFALLEEQHGEERSLTLVHADGRLAQLLSESSGASEAMPLNDGGALVRWSANQRQHLLLLGPDGVVSKRRWLMWSQYSGSMLATKASEPGLVLEDEGGGEPRFYSLEPGSEPAALALPVSRVAPACRAAPAAEALTLFGAGSFVLRVARAKVMPAAGGGPHSVGASGVGVLEVNGQSACLRAGYGSLFSSATLRLDASGVEAVLTDARTSYPLRCRPMTPAELHQAARESRIR